jgi:metallophosphoesterase (TIGR00282 family)
MFMVVFMRVLFLGEIVGKAGHFTLKHLLKNLVDEKGIDFVIANANGATGGFGLGKSHAITLRKKGIRVLTGGECIYYKKDIVEYLPKAPWILRPANLPPGIPGRGWGVYDSPAGDIGVICMIGQSGYTRTHGNNPYTYLPEIVRKVKERTDTIILNFHATTSAERRTMAFHSDGMISAMIGTGTRCQTADSKVLPGGTAIITDAGRTGSRSSVFGMDSETEMRILLSRIPERSKDGWGDLRLQGAILDIGPDGRSRSIEAIDIPCKEEPDDTNGNSSQNRR